MFFFRMHKQVRFLAIELSHFTKIKHQNKKQNDEYIDRDDDDDNKNKRSKYMYI